MLFSRMRFGLMPYKAILEQVKNLSSCRENEKPTIVAYGLMNAGKSFLLNMLTQHIDQEFFKTNDVRETAEIKQFESEHYIYLDTPGLDANDSDDFQATRGVSQADVVLFLHQPQGALEANEVSFLKGLKKSFSYCAESNIILILSKIEKEDQDKIDQIEIEIRRQCLTEIGFSPNIFQVSNKRYQAGMIRHKDGLVNQSHIKSLIEHIDIVASNSRKVRAQRSLTEVEALLEQATAREQMLKSRRMQIRDTLEQIFAQFNGQVESLNGFLEDSSKKYRAI